MSVLLKNLKLSICFSCRRAAEVCVSTRTNPLVNTPSASLWSYQREFKHNRPSWLFILSLRRLLGLILSWLWFHPRGPEMFHVCLPQSCWLWAVCVKCKLLLRNPSNSLVPFFDKIWNQKPDSNNTKRFSQTHIRGYT